MTAPPWEQGVSRSDRYPIVCVTDITLYFHPGNVKVNGNTADLETEV